MSTAASGLVLRNKIQQMLDGSDSPTNQPIAVGLSTAPMGTSAVHVDACTTACRWDMLEGNGREFIPLPPIIGIEKENGELQHSQSGASTATPSPREASDVSDQPNKIDAILALIESSKTRKLYAEPLKDRRSLHSWSLDASSFAKVELIAKLETARLEIDQKNEMIENLRSELALARDEFASMTDATSVEHKKQLRATEQRLTATSTRNLEQIDKLISEKRDLSAKLNAAKSERAELDQQVSAKLQRCEEVFRKELTREKENWATTEKASRHRWELKRVTEIKEQTIKGLEPEIERILAAHKQEKKIVDTKHAEELQRINTEWMLRLTEEVREARGLVRDDVRVAVEAERSSFKKKEEERFEEHIRELDEERRKRKDDIAKIRAELDLQMNDIRQGAKLEVEEVRNEYESRLRMLIQEHEQADMLNRQDRDSQIAVGIEDRLRVLEAKMEADMHNFREEVMAEKDRLVEEAIDRIARENVALVQCTKHDEYERYQNACSANEAEIESLQMEVLKLRQTGQDSAARHAQINNELAQVHASLRQKDDEIAKLLNDIKGYKAEVDNAKFDKLELVQQLKMKDGKFDAFRSNELAGLERHVKALADQKDRELHDMEDKLKYLEAKNVSLTELLTRGRLS